MDDGVELKQLTVGVDSVGLGVGAGLASAIVLMAISAASVVIVLIICCLSNVCGCLVVIAGQPLWQSRRNLLWGWGAISHLVLRELPGKVLERSCSCAFVVTEISRFSALSLLLAGAA